MVFLCLPASAGETVFSDDFESGTVGNPTANPWTLVGAGGWFNQEFVYDNVHNHTAAGSKSAYSVGYDSGTTNDGVGAWSMNPGWGPLTNGRAQVWFYDDMQSPKTQYTAVDNDTGNNWLAILVRTPTSATKYCYRGSMVGTQVTSIDRTLGWHKVTWVRDSNNTTVYLDDVEVYSTPNAMFSNFNDFDLGSWSWDSDNTNSAMWFDDCLVERGAHQRLCRWYDDDDAESPTALAAQNAPISGVTSADLRRLRVQLQNDMSVAWSGAYVGLRYRIGTSGTWTDFGAGAHWNYADGQGTDGNQVANALLTGTDTRQHFVESLPSTASLAVSSGDQAEWDFAIQATANMVPGATYYFKVVETNAAGSYLRDLMSYPVLAELSTTSAGLKVWDGSDGTQWGDPANWTPAGVPTATDDVYIPAIVPDDPRVNVPAVAASLFLENLGFLDLTSNNDSLTVTGAVILEGTVTHNTNTTFTVTNGPVTLSGTYDHSGTGNFTATGVDFTIQDGGQYDLSSNAATFTCGALEIEANADFNQTNTSTVNVDDLTIDLGGEYTCTNAGSAINVADDFVSNGSMVDSTGGVWTFTGADGLISGASTTTRFYDLNVSSGTTTLDAAGVVGVLNSASVAGGAAFVMDGGTTLEMTGGTTLTATGSFSTTGTSLLTDYTTIRASSGNYSIDLGGDVDVAYAKIQDLSDAGLTLSGATGISPSFKATVFETSQTAGGRYLAVTGTAWNNYTFVGLAFDEVGAGANMTNTVEFNIPGGGNVTLTSFGVAPTYSSGDTTDTETTGTVTWGPLSATVCDFRAVAAPGGTRITWRALSEWGCVGYRARRTGAARGADASGLVPAKGPGRYAVAAMPAPVGTRYVLEAVNSGGKARVLGAAVLAPGASGNVLPGFSPGGVPFECARRPRPGPKAIAPTAPGARLKLTTSRRGFYWVGPDGLSAAGLGRSAGLELSCMGEPQPVETELQRRRPGRAIFFGREYADRYTDGCVYWLGGGPGPARGRKTAARALLGARKGLLTSVRAARGLGGLLGRRTSPPDAYIENVRVERDERYVAGFRNAEAGEERWFFQQVLRQGDTLSVAAEVVDPLDTKAAKLRVALRSMSEFDGIDPDHTVRLAVNGFEVGELRWDGATRFVGSAEVPAGALVSGDNELSVTVDPASGGAWDTVLVDWFELSYARPLSAIDDQIALELSVRRGRVVRVGGFSAGRVMCADVTDPARPELVEVVTRRGGDGDFAACFRAPCSGLRRFFLAAEPAWREPLAELVSPAAVSGEAVDYLVVAPRGLVGSAAPLVEHHRGAGMAVEVAAAEDIYDSCGWGFFGPEAIRRYISMRSPRYVLLLGDATYDYRGRVSEPPAGLIPAFAVQDIFFEVPSDHAYGCVASTKAGPRVAVGRLPARDAAGAAALVSKVLARSGQSGSPRWEAVLAADDDAPGFSAGIESLGELMAGQQAKIHMAELGAATARSELLAELLAGAWYCVYLGHGSSGRWAAEGLLKISDAAALEGAAVSTVTLELTCLTGRFDGDTDSLSEAMLRTGSGGFAGAVAPSGMTDQPGQMVLAREFLRGISRGQTLGEALAAAKRAAGADYRRVSETFNLLGDPAGR